MKMDTNVDTSAGSSDTKEEGGVCNDPELWLYPVENEFIGQINISHVDTGKTKINKSTLSTIVILDRSSSMGDAVARFVNVIIPKVFQKLEYASDDIIHLITFDDQVEKIDATIDILSLLDICERGCTDMKPAVQMLNTLICNELPKDQRGIRLLTISDGDVWDQEETQTAASELATLIQNKFEINSQAVRLFTSDDEPDTRALSSILQLNNLSKVNLLDLSEELSDEDISSAISELFVDDGLTYQMSLTSEERIFKKSPWVTDFSNKITVFPGENVFWLEKVPEKILFIESTIVPVKLQPEITLETYEQLLKKKIDHYMTQLKIFKVVNTAESTTAISNIVTYFQKRENYILNKEEDVQLILNNPSLRSRLHYLKTLISRRNKTFSMRMAQIANDEKVSQLNSAQQAEYLRAIDSSKNSRGLARRALNQGIDFNETIRKEVRAMSEHIDELKEVNDKDHEVSFYSRETTLGGIRVVCDLVKEDILDDLDANDILLMLNIVGVACSGPIGDFPDPMTWRINKLYLGCNISLSDILTAFVQSPGTIVKTPGTELEITNVIPVFEDNRITKFLRNYAPSLLEYTCSIGMRRVIADVPMTCGYTMCAGVWKMIEDLNVKKSELHLKTFERFVLNYEVFVGRYFEHILPHIKDQQQNHISYYIANNGITNMISPLITINRLNDDKLQHIPDILRALYTYEIWQAIRRLYKNRDNSDMIIKDMLTKLLGIDIDKNKTHVTPLFVEEPDIQEIKFYHDPLLNQSYLSELVKNFYYLKYVALMPKYFNAVVTGNTNSIINIPAVTDETICEALKIDYDLKTFHFYNIIQALLFTTKASRVDTEKEVMTIIDLQYEQEGEKMVKEYIRKQFENQYLSDLAVKKRTEQLQLAEFLVESILRATKHKDVVDLMRNGVTRGEVKLKITNSSSLGFAELKQKLVDLKENIPLRTYIIKLFLLGRDCMNNNEIVWNNGGVTFVYNLQAFGIAFKSSASPEEWDQVVAEYKERGIHIYREKVNRHKHGNTKPSYSAFGYPTLQHYKNDVTEEEFKKYCAEHADCCGVSQFLGLISKV